MSNTYEKVEYVILTLFYSVIFMIWYRRIIFRSISGMTYKYSKFVLWCIVILMIAIGIAVTWLHQRNGVNVVTTIVIPYGIYTVCTYYDYRKRLIFVLCFAIVFFFMMCCIYILKNKCKNRSRSVSRKVCRCFWRLREIVAGVMLVLMGSIVACTLFDGTLMQASVNAINGTNKCAEGQTIANNLDTVLLFQDKEWERLTMKQKLNALQIIVNIEVNYLGISHELNVEAANLEEGILGRYDDYTHRIIINYSLLENGRPEILLETICHEAFHGYQYSIVEVYNESDENFKKLQIFRKAASYKQEFDNYSNGVRSSYESYYLQDCEKDARLYAQSAVEDYYKRIEEYLCSS